MHGPCKAGGSGTDTVYYIGFCVKGGNFLSGAGRGRRSPRAVSVERHRKGYPTCDFGSDKRPLISYPNISQRTNYKTVSGIIFKEIPNKSSSQ